MAIQFSWIFILIVGALILVFFFSIISKQKTFSQQSLDNKMLEYFDNIISGTNVKIGTVENTSLVGYALELSPNYIRVAGSVWEGIPLRNRILFSPNIIKGDKLITYADYWSLPYKIDYFIYLTSNEVKYYIVDDVSTEEDSVYINQLLDLLPRFVTREVIGDTSIGNLADKNDYKIRFIFVNYDKKDPAEFEYFDNIAKKQDFSAISIFTDDISLDTHGTINFYKKNDEHLELDDTSYYIKKELLLGAIYSEDYYFYNTSLKKILDKLDVITNIYKDNALSLKEYTNLDYNLKVVNECPQTYDELLINLQKILNNDKQVTEESFEAMHDANSEIKGYNGELIFQSCPILY